MWWKLVLLVLVTGALILSVIPIRTHAVKWDVYNEPPPQAWSFAGLLRNVYVTPTTMALVGAILLVSAGVAFWIVRGPK